MGNRTIAQIEDDLPSPTKRAQAAVELAALTLIDPDVAWPCLTKWGGGDDAPAREAIATAVVDLVSNHLDEVAPAFARAVADDVRFGNVVLPPCLRVIHGDRFRFLQKQLRAALAGSPPDDQPTIESVLDEEDLDFFAMDLMDHLLSREDPSEAEEAALRVLMLSVEVPGGGFRQFFWNSAGDAARETVSALKRIDALAHAHLLQQANGAFGSAGPATDYDVRRKQMDALGEPAERTWHSLDEAYYKTGEDLIGLLRKHVRMHRDEFGG